MKKGWKTVTLGEVCEFLDRRGVTPEKLGSQFRSDGFRVISAKNIKGREIDTTIGEQRFVDEPTYRRWMKSPLMADDVILTSEAPLGEPAYASEELNWCLGQRLFGVRSDKSKLKGRFLFYAFQASPVRDDMLSRATGATAQGIRQSELTKVELPLPPLAEQQRIVGVLDEAFAGLATAQAHAAQNLQNARALFESHLQSVFTHRGKGWVEKRLPEVAREFGRGKSKHRPRNEPKLYGGKYPFVQTGDISNADHWLTEYSQTYSEAGLAQSKLWPRGTVCIAIVGATVGESAILDFEACFPDSVIGIIVDDYLADREFVEYLLQSFKAVLKEKGKGTARDNINLGTFESQFFPFPDLKEQKKAVSTLNALAAETQRLTRLYEQKQAALAALKKSLLHQAFTGEL